MGLVAVSGRALCRGLEISLSCRNCGAKHASFTGAGMGGSWATNFQARAVRTGWLGLVDLGCQGKLSRVLCYLIAVESVR